MKLRFFATAAAALLLVLCAIFACTSLPNQKARRGPSSEENERLRVATYELSPENSMVLIGIDRSQTTDPNIIPIDATQAGFKSSQDITHLDPKFLLTVNRDGIQQVYSFELGKLKIDDPSHIKPELPRMLLDLHKWRLQLLDQDPISQGLEVANYIVSLLELKGIKDFWSVVGVKWENDRKAQASYLEQIISQALEQNAFPELLNALPAENWRSEMEDLGAALTVRYRLSIYSGILQSGKAPNRDALYRTLRANMIDHSNRQLSALDERANTECLVVERISTNMAMLEFQKDHYKDCVAYNGRRLDLKGRPDEIVAKIPELRTDEQGRIPLSLYILNDQDQFVELVDFTNPDKLRDHELLEKIHQFGLSMGELFSPTLVSIGLESADTAIMFMIQKKGSTIVKQRVAGFADLIMMMETGLTYYHLDGFVKTALIENMKKAKAPADQLARVEQGLSSSDPEVVKNTFDDVMVYFGYREQGVRGFGGGSKAQANADHTRTARWLRYTEWLKSQHNLNRIDTALSHRSDEIKENQTKHEAKIEAKAKAEEEAKESGKPQGSWFSRLFHPDGSSPWKDFVRDPEGDASTGPTASSRTVPSSSDPKAPRPVILFMVDGLRPDRVHLAASRGQLPNIKARFLDQGVQLNSYTNYTVSLPSWTTVMTGFEPDQHGLHGSSTATRDPKVKWTNLLDFRPDTYFFVIGKESRLYKRINQNGIKPLQEYVDPGKVLFSTVPVARVGSIPVRDAIKQMLSEYQRLAFGTFGMDPMLDLASGNHVVKALQQNPGKYRMLMMWFGGVDHSAHADNHSMFDSYRALDESIGNVLAAAKKDPLLKDAVVFLVSDHGEMGGEELADPDRKPIPEAFFLNNSTFNLMQFFTGDLPDSRDYNFVASGSKASEPFVDAGTMGWALNNVWEPYFYTYHGTQKNKGKPGYRYHSTILTEPFGDAMAQIIFLDANKDHTKRLSYYDLTHLPAPTKRGVTLNVVKDLLEHTVYNVEWDDSIKKRMSDFSRGKHAVKFVAIPLQGAMARISAEQITGNDPSRPSTRDPVVVQSLGGKSALILTRDTDDGEISMRYVPIKNFDQAPDGTISGRASMDPDDDPFDYLAEGVKWDPLPWKTDREWVALLESTSYPTAISSIPRKTTLHKSIANVPDVMAELPDIELESAYGFTFNSFQMHEGDHGGLTREQVKTSFFVSDDQMPKGLLQIKTPVFNRDMGATIIDYLGATPVKGMPGRSMKPVIENVTHGSN